MDPLTVTRIEIPPGDDHPERAEVTYTYRQRGKEHTVTETFYSTAQIITQLSRTALSALNADFETWLNHKQIIINEGDAHYRQRMSVQEGLSKCTGYLVYSVKENLTLEQGCQYLLRIRHHMAAILPHVNNKQYPAARNRMNEFIAFAEKVAKGEYKIIPEDNSKKAA